MTQALTKKKLVKKTPVKPQWARPVEVRITAQFDGGRKVVLADLERAAAAAGAAFRASLEGRSMPYELERCEAEVAYSYLQSRRSFDI